MVFTKQSLNGVVIAIASVVGMSGVAFADEVSDATQSEVQPQTLVQPAAQESLTGRVQTTEAQLPDEILTMTVEEDPAGQKLSKQHKAVRIVLKNTTPVHLEVLQAEVMNAVDEQVIAVQQAEKKNSGRKVGGAFLRLGQAGLGFIPYAGVGLGGAYALSAANQVAGGAASVMESSSAGAAGNTTGQYTRGLSNVFISPNESYSFKAIIPKKDAPAFRVVFKNLTTNQILNYQK